MAQTKRTSDNEGARREPKKTKLEMDQETFKKVLEVVGKRVEAIEYLHQNIEGRLDPEVVAEVAQLRDYASFLERVRGNPWLGNTMKPVGKDTDFHNFQEYLANKAGSVIHEKNLVMDCAISDNAEFIRGYTSDGQPLGDVTTDALDKLFNAWLATQRIETADGQVIDFISKDGFIYKAVNGEIIQDMQGTPVKVDPNEFRVLLSEQATGFEAFVRKNNKDVEHVAIHLHPYPEETPEPTSPS
jgi:hypothetical protein